MTIPCLFLLDNLGVGGSERKTIVAANLLAERGFSIYMGFLNVTHDVSNTLHPAIKHISFNRKGKLDIAVIREIRGYIANNGIGVIWAVNLYPTLYMYFSARPYRHKIRLIGASNITIFRSGYERMKMSIYTPIIRSLDAFVFGSFKQKEEWQAKYRFNKQNMEVVHNGVDVSHFSTDAVDSTKASAKQQYGFDADDVVIGMVAQFRPEKAHTDLLAACYKLRRHGYPVKLLLVGGGVEEDKIRLCANEFGITEDVIFAGQLDDVRPALNAMDIFALTSKAVETFSNAALEAMAMGLPAVLSDLSGASEMVNDGENGCIYPPGNVDALAQALELLLEVKKRQNYGRRAREIVVERFSADAMAGQYSKIILGEPR